MPGVGPGQTEPGKENAEMKPNLLQQSKATQPADQEKIQPKTPLLRVRSNLHSGECDTEIEQEVCKITCPIGTCHCYGDGGYSCNHG
jgi:hypothetical protein